MCLVGRDPLNNVLTRSPEDILANITEWSGKAATNKFPYLLKKGQLQKQQEQSLKNRWDREKDPGPILKKPSDGFHH
jgi:hypothetical protein